MGRTDEKGDIPKIVILGKIQTVKLIYFIRTSVDIDLYFLNLPADPFNLHLVSFHFRTLEKIFMCQERNFQVRSPLPLLFSVVLHFKYAHLVQVEILVLEHHVESNYWCWYCWVSYIYWSPLGYFFSSLNFLEVKTVDLMMKGSAATFLPLSVS